MGKNKYPTSKAGKIALAQAMLNGLTVDAADYPNPPVKTADLQNLLNKAIEDRNARIIAAAEAMEKTEAETESFDDLDDAIRDNIKYGELVTKGDDAKLQKIGWSGRAAPKALAVPGAPGAFEVIKQGKGWAQFDWKESKTGGKASMFKILGMETGSADGWKNLGSSVLPENTVTGMISGKEYIFCVVGVNAAGTGEQSNAVTLFL